MSSVKRIFRDPWFLLGFVIRLALIGLVTPKAASQWYVPFMTHILGMPTLDPWGSFLAAGGDPAAFPYGYVMALVLLPFSMVARLAGLSPYIGYALSLLAADLAMLLTLRRMLAIKDRQLLIAYWLSPIVLFATYWLGLNDLIPVLLLTLALRCCQQRRMGWSGALCGAAVSAKLSMILALPFFAIYLFRNKALRRYISTFIAGLGAATLVLCAPFAASSSGVSMLFHNPEMAKTYELAINVGDALHIYLLPMAYLLILYISWRITRISFDLFSVALGLAFFLVVLLTPASPGWFIWIMPLLVFYQVLGGRTAMVLVGSFTGLYLFLNLLVAPVPDLQAWIGPHAAHLPVPDHKMVGVLQTILFTLGVILLVRIWRAGITSTNFFRLSRAPFVVGIAGDSGSGKDTLGHALEGLFGSHSTVQLSGDDYHLWDRKKPMWQVMTHLNPRANDLERYAKDLLDLVDGKSINSRHYDHATGMMSHPHKIKSNDFVIASGLHALHLPLLRQCYDLRVYLDIDEDLRRHLKLQRDVHVRGHTPERVLASLERREVDSARFIRPQTAHADLVMSLQPIHRHLITDALAVENPVPETPMRLKLCVRSRNGFNEESLVRTLVGVCGLHVDITVSDDDGSVSLAIEGETSGEDISLAARQLFPQLGEFLTTEPSWKDGPLGLMQLIVLSHMNQSLSTRLL